MKHLKQFFTLSAAFFLISSSFPTSLLAQGTFSDVIGHSYQDSIDFLAERNIVQGHSDGLFRADEPLNRAELMKILIEQRFGTPKEALSNCFKDVANEWFATYVCQGHAEGIVDGYPDGRFGPGREVNMAEGLKMVFENFEIQNVTATEGENWFVPYVEFAHEHSLFSKHSYLPNRSMTRGEMSFLVHQLILDQEALSPLKTGARYLSSGCGTAAPNPVPTQSQVNGLSRHYITVIPDDYNINTPKKLIFAFHGRTNSNSDVRGYYKVEQAAGNEAIMIYPSGLPTNSSPRNWADAGNSASELRDYAFFDQLLEEFSSDYCIDLDEVYVVGHSLGAWFTNSLACQRGNVIRGVGTLGGGTSIGECTGPVATMIWHNPNDRLAPFSSGEVARDQYIRQNQCGQATVSVAPAAGNCVAYQGCYKDAPVVWCPHTLNEGWNGSYYPHNWPKIAGPEIWTFFKSLED